jgi:preprotein translocase subunit SecG
VETALLVLFLLVAVLLMLLVLIQRGRGGGLAGAFGGPGGHSAFGTKTADVFIKTTAVIGAIFFVLAIVTALYMRYHGGSIFSENEPAPAKAPAEPGGKAPPAESGGATPSAPADEGKAANK